MRSNGATKPHVCFCRVSIQESNLLDHSLGCEEFKKVFEDFPAHLHKIISKIKDGDILRILIGMLSNARSICELKLKDPASISQSGLAKPYP